MLIIVVDIQSLNGLKSGGLAHLARALRWQ
jgi:hypothetical protein